MIFKEFFMARQDGVKLYRSYSDKGVQIRKVGTDEVYDEAIDVESALYIYEETDEVIVQTQEQIEGGAEAPASH